MWIYDEISKELVNINENINNICKHKHGELYKIYFQNISGKEFYIEFEKEIECDNYFLHIKNLVKPIEVDPTHKPLTL